MTLEILKVRHGGVWIGSTFVIEGIVALDRGAFNVDADLHVLTPSPDPGILVIDYQILT